GSATIAMHFSAEAASGRATNGAWCDGAMSYRFRKKAPLAREVRRVAHERLERGLAAMLAGKKIRGEAIHEARKNIKQTRALLWLIRNATGAKFFKNENREL